MMDFPSARRVRAASSVTLLRNVSFCGHAVGLRVVRFAQERVDWDKVESSGLRPPIRALQRSYRLGAHGRAMTGWLNKSAVTLETHFYKGGLHEIALQIRVDARAYAHAFCLLVTVGGSGFPGVAGRRLCLERQPAHESGER